MGLSPSKSKTTTVSNANTVTTPNVPSWISQPYQQLATSIGGLGQQQTFGPTANQQQAFTRAGGLGGNPAIGQGMDATRGLLNFNPATVNAGQLGDTDLSRYFNPFENQVVQGALADIEGQRGRAISGGQSAATMSGAYGGSRHGVADSLTNDAALRAAGSTSGQLRSAGFQNAQQMALADIINRLGADQFNSQQGLAGAGLRLGAAGQLGQQGLAADANERDNLGLMSGLGAQERAIQQENDPYTTQLRALLARAGLLNMIPADTFTGQSAQQSGTSTTTTPTGGWLAALGSAFNGMGGLNISTGGGKG